MLLGVPERSFYEVLRFLQKKIFFYAKIFFSADRIFEKFENLRFSKNLRKSRIFEKSKNLNFLKDFRFS